MRLPLYLPRGLSFVSRIAAIIPGCPIELMLQLVGALNGVNAVR